jgi:hypothetical protein
MGVHGLAGTPHLAGDLPTGVTDTTVACPGSSSLSLFRKEKGPQNFRTRQSAPVIHLRSISFAFSNGVRISWSSYSAVMTISSHWYVTRYFVTEYPSPKVFFISFDVWQNVSGKLKTSWFIVRLKSLHNLRFVCMEVNAVMNNPPNSRVWYN